MQIVFTAATEFPEFSEAFENAIRLAIEEHPAIRGFPVQLNVIETTCDGDNEAAAESIVANAQDSRNRASLLCGLYKCTSGLRSCGPRRASGSTTADQLRNWGRRYSTGRS